MSTGLPQPHKVHRRELELLYRCPWELTGIKCDALQQAYIVGFLGKESPPGPHRWFDTVN